MAPPVRVLHLVRHGSVTDAALDDPELDAQGTRQAELVGARLAAMRGLAPIARVASSELRRAVQTADVIAGALGDVERAVDDSLSEGFPTAPHPRLRAPVPDGVDLEAEAARFERCWETFFGGSEAPVVEVLVSHGNWIRGLTIRALGAEANTWYRLGFHHCGLTTVMITPDGPYLARFNDVGHLPPELVTVR